MTPHAQTTTMGRFGRYPWDGCSRLSLATHGMLWMLVIVALSITGLGCTVVVHEDADRVITATDCDSLFVDHDSSSTAAPDEPDFICPTITNGDVVFSIAGYPDRTVNFSNVAGSSASGPLFLYWHGTYEGANNPITNALPYGFASQASTSGALVAMPRADQAAIDRPDGDFPWWTVCSQVNPQQCNRDDDFVLAEAIVECAIAQGLASPNRLTSSGMSAGGIMTTRLVEAGIGVHSLAAAVPWSGGESPAQQPTLADDPRTAVLAFHGGASDTYCGPGNPAGTCGGYQPYSFVQPTEQLASDVDDGVADSDGFAAVCNHGSGHTNAMGPQGAEFLAVADLAGGHPWRAFPYGVDGYGAWPSMSAGTNWMLRFYGDCHNAL